MVNLAKAREIDFHNYRLLEAELKVCDSLEEAWCAGEDGLLFIHGYHNGVAIKSYIRGRKGLQAKWRKDFPDLPQLEVIPKDQGCTWVRFEAGD